MGTIQIHTDAYLFLDDPDQSDPTVDQYHDTLNYLQRLKHLINLARKKIDPTTIYWTVEELAKYARLPQDTIRYHIRRGHIKAVLVGTPCDRAGARYLIHTEDAAAFAGSELYEKLAAHAAKNVSAPERQQPMDRPPDYSTRHWLRFLPITQGPLWLLAISDRPMDLLWRHTLPRHAPHANAQPVRTPPMQPGDIIDYSGTTLNEPARYGLQVTQVIPVPNTVFNQTMLTVRELDYWIPARDCTLRKANG